MSKGSGVPVRSRGAKTDKSGSCSRELFNKNTEGHSEDERCVLLSHTNLDRNAIEESEEHPAFSKPLEKKTTLKRLSKEEHDVKKASQYFQSEDFKKLAPNVFVYMNSDPREIDGDLTEGFTNSDNEGSDSDRDPAVTMSNGESGNGSSRSRLATGSYDFVRAVRDVGSSDVEISSDDGDSDFDSDLECSSLSVSECEDDDDVNDNDEKQHVDGYSKLNQPEDDEVDASCVLISEARRGSYFDNYGDRETELNILTSQREQSKLSGPPLNKKSRTLSYEQACSEEGSNANLLYEIQPHIVGYGNPGIPGDDIQLSPMEDSAEESQVDDPHGLIRKPAMRRKGFAWSSKSLPRNTDSAQMRHKYRSSIDSSQDLESTLVNLYGHRPAARTNAQENDSDHIVPPAARKTQSLPTRTDQHDETHYRDVIRPTSDRLQLKMDTEATVPKFVSTSGDNMKRPLSMSSVSSNSLTSSPSLSKKKDSTADEDGSRSFLENMNSNYAEESDRISGTVSSLEFRHSMDSDLFNEHRNGDGYMDSTSITSSEADNYRNDFESSPVTPPTSSDKINSSSIEDPRTKPVPSTESYSTHPDLQSSGDNSHESADSLRLSSSSASRHEARMKFFTNYEEYLNQPTTSHDSVAVENVNSASRSHEPSSSKSSSLLPLSASTITSPSVAEVNKNGDSYSHSSSQDNKSFTPSATSSEDRRDNSSKLARSSERTSRRSDRRGSNAKHEGLSSRSGFSRSSKKRDHVASSEPGSRTSQGFVSYVSRVVTEIIESERMYIASLEDIIHGYLEPMEKMLTSKDAKTDLRCLFSNIRDIYKFGCTFLADLEMAGTDCVKVAQCFVKHNQGFVIYTDYCTNYPRAVEVLTRFMQHPELSELCKQRQIALGHGLPLGAYLLKPVQRILKYHLLLHNLVKTCDKGKEESDILEQAFHHMTEMAHHINEMKRKHEHAVRIQEIQSQLEDYVGEDLTRLRDLVLEDTFKIYGAKASRQVFLFERGLLISKKKGGGMLSCKAFIQCSNLMLVEVIPNEPLSFHIIPFDNPRTQYTLQARNMEQKKKWCQDIKQLILESFKGRIPDNVKNLIMQLGREHDDDYVSKEALEAGRKNQHTAPEYLEKRRFRGKSGSRIPDFSLLKPQKAKRGGNKKGEVRSRENVSQERAGRRESKSPEGHRRIFSKQNAVSKSRSQSPMSPPIRGSEFDEPNFESAHSISELVFKDKNLFPTSLLTSPESPEHRTSRKFTYDETGDKEKPVDIIKRPASFLLARENPILSGDLTNLLTRSGQPAKSQSSLSLTKCEENNDTHPSLKPQHDSIRNSLKNTADTKISFQNDENEHPASEGNSSRINSNCTDTAPNLTVSNDGHISKLSEKISTLVDHEVCASFDENVKEPTESESNITKSLGKNKSIEGDELGKTEKEHKQAAIPEQKSASDGTENIYENINIPTGGHQMQISHQNVNKMDEVANNSEEESQAISCHDRMTAAENAVKKKALRIPNTSQHLMTHDYHSDPNINGTKAKLTNWNSKEKLTKGSMDDLSYLDEDPWVKNSEATTSTLNIDEESPTTLRPVLPIPTRPRGHSDVDESMQISSHQENLDWMVYLNRISPSWSQIQSPGQEELRASTSALEKYSTAQNNKQVNSKFPSQNPCATPPRNYLATENIKRRSSVDNGGESSRSTSNLTTKKGNAFGISPVTVSIIKPVSFSSRGLVRSNSTPISDFEQGVIDKAVDRGRPVSLDMGRITGHDCRKVVDMNSSESMRNTSEITSVLPTIRIEEEEEASSNRLSVVSSISTSSYDESQSNSSSDGLVGAPKNKHQSWTKQNRIRHDSEISCTSTLTSDDEEKENIHTKSNNTFEPAAKNRSSWKEDRQLEVVLREHSLGSSKLGSRMAQIYTQPLEQVIRHHHHPDSSCDEFHPQSMCGFASEDKVFEENEKVSADQDDFSVSPIEATEALFPPVSKITDIPKSEKSHESNNQNHESSISDENSVKHEIMSEASLELSEESSKEEVTETNQNVSASKTMKDNSVLARSDSIRSLHSNDSCYERRFSAAFDSEDFIEDSETDKHNEQSSKEVPFSKKSIREYVKDLEEKFKAQSPKVVEVRRREPGTMIRQRLETLRESALHGWRNLSPSTSKPACDEKSFLFHHNIKTFTMRNDSVNENHNKYDYLRSSKSKDSFSKSVENLSKSRDNVFLSASRDSISSISRSRDSLNSVSDVTGNRHSAPVFSLKTNNSGHEKDANRFHYRTPENNQAFSGNQFIHRAYSGSQHSLSESEAQHVLEEGTGSISSIKPAKSAYRLNEPSSDVDNLLVMKGWVRSLISKFQVK